MQDGQPAGSSLLRSEHDEEEHRRQRRFHRRSRNGCQHCKKRRVRCDEARPVCGNCVRKKEEHMCQYSFSMTTDVPGTTPWQSTSSGSSSPPPPAPLQPAFNGANGAIDHISGPANSEGGPASVWPLQSPAAAPTSEMIQSDSLNLLFGPTNDSSGSGLPFLPVSLDDMFVQMPQWLFNHTSDIPSSSQATIQLFDDVSLPSAQPSALDALLGAADSLVPVTNGTVPNLPPYPAYTHQANIVSQPEELATYFPTAEQRQLFRHFIHETASDLVVTPVTPGSNPWLMYLSPLALGEPFGSNVSHDAFRCALLSLASFDMGMKINGSLRSKEDNAMYALSEEQRTGATNLLDMRALADSGISRSDKEITEAADLTIAVAIALSIRDRLAGTQDWEKPLALGTTAITSLGGPAAYLDRRPTRDRRFLLEQMACIEILGMMTIWYAPKIMTWDNDWLFRADEEDAMQDHMHIVYGWDRPTLQFCARSMILGDEARQVEFLKRGNANYGFEQVKIKVQNMEQAVLSRSNELLQEVQTLRVKAMSVRSTRAARGIMSVLHCMEISILAGGAGREVSEPQIQKKVKAVLDTIEEAISQGMYAGFLLPLLWMAICAVAENKQRVNRLMILLQPHYHIEPGLLKRLIHVDWSQYANANFEQWDEIMKSTNTYVPVF
ncbi:hypothetical protein IAT40_003055 [Kwoniella sp. CBS 6097]